MKFTSIKNLTCFAAMGAMVWMPALLDAGILTVEGGLNVEGDVGIGTEAPTKKLDVAGDAKVSGELIVGAVKFSDDSILSSASTGRMYNSAGDLMFSTENASISQGIDGLVAIGNGAIVSGWYGVAIGQSVTAGGYRSMAFGSSNSSTGSYSVTLGVILGASGEGAAAIGGSNNTASGDYSVVAGGRYNTAAGDYSAAWGNYVTAQAAGSFVIGRNNRYQGTVDQWIPEDDIFVIGNGEASYMPQRLNIFTVHKNGNVRAAGSIQAKGGFRTPPMGDLDMGAFKAGANPAALSTDPEPGLDAGLRYPGE